ncbi:hypothetical protein [Pseudomonas bohemica]|uniref:hypothetical protein n=1 Tax=Pseudomonas bohemica TaxID=2044872 RepID=UPI000DA61B37|nr:hypothetical protein [Pseudomonas bohemica]
MKKALEKYAKRLQKDAEVAFIRRMMWIDMEARIREMFREIESSPQAGWYGGMKIHNGLHPEANDIPANKRLNHLQVTCMTRLLGLSSVTEAEETREIEGVEQKVRLIKRTTHLESDSAMWFTQTPCGGVTVFMAPYRSDLVSVNEKEIVIGMFKDPVQLTEGRLRRLFARYFKYMSMTSALHDHTVLDYAWRLLLMYLDVRSRRVWKTFVAINVLVMFGAALFIILGYFINSPAPSP